MPLAEEEKLRRKEAKQQRLLEWERYKAEQEAKAIQDRKDQLERYAQQNRDNATAMERKIKPELEERGFVHQQIIGDFIVDFYHPLHRIVVEVDGISHEGRQTQDRERDQVLMREARVILHLPDSSVKGKFEQCLEVLNCVMDLYEALRQGGASIILPESWRFGHVSYHLTPGLAVEILERIGAKEKFSEAVELVSNTNRRVAVR